MHIVILAFRFCPRASSTCCTAGLHIPGWASVGVHFRRHICGPQAWGADQEATKQLWRDVAAQRAHLAEQREELQRLEAELPPRGPPERRV